MSSAYSDLDYAYQTLCADVDLSKPYIFISYSHEDADDVIRLLSVMHKNHFRFWFDKGIRPSAAWQDVISDRITECSQFLCFITKSSVGSDNVQDEIHIAKKYGKPILPVYLDDTVLLRGLELSLDRFHALSRQDCSEAVFHRRLCASLDRRTLDHIVTRDCSAMEELKRHYRIIRQIGGGFSGKVYIAESVRTGCNMIIKHATLDDTYTGSALRDAYLNEKEVLVRQTSTHTPVVVDFFADNSNIFLVETLVPGVSLGKTYNLSDDEIVKIFLQTARVLKRYHNQGVVHCDVKPEHILLHDDEVHLIDFGSCYLEEYPDRYHLSGSACYAAPEQFGISVEKADRTGAGIDRRVDIYALGRSLMFTLARNHGLLILEEEDKTVLLHNCFEDMRDRYTLDQKRYRREISPLLRAVIDKMTARDPSDRFDSMDEVIDCLSMF